MLCLLKEMMKRILTAALILAGTTITKAQLAYNSWEFGASVGASQYFGDLNPELRINYISGAGGILAKYNFSHYIGLRASLHYTQLGAKDSRSSNAYEKKRNLNFYTHIIEGAVQAEFNFFRFATGDKDHRWTPYLTGGIGIFSYNPYTYLDGVKYDLREMGTEGQNTGGFNDRKYSNRAVCFPIGAGFKYWLKPGLNLGFEISHRLTRTDYIDDVSHTYVGSDKFNPNGTDKERAAYQLQDRSYEVSDKLLGTPGKQRGNSNSYDQYLMLEFTLTWTLKSYVCPSF